MSLSFTVPRVQSQDFAKDLNQQRTILRKHSLLLAECDCQINRTLPSFNPVLHAFRHYGVPAPLIRSTLIAHLRKHPDPRTLLAPLMLFENRQQILSEAEFEEVLTNITQRQKLGSRFTWFEILLYAFFQDIRVVLLFNSFEVHSNVLDYTVSTQSAVFMVQDRDKLEPCALAERNYNARLQWVSGTFDSFPGRATVKQEPTARATSSATFSQSESAPPPPQPSDDDDVMIIESSPSPPRFPQLQVVPQSRPTWLSKVSKLCPPFCSRKSSNRRISLQLMSLI